MQDATVTVQPGAWPAMRQRLARFLAGWLGVDADEVWTRTDCAAGRPWELTCARTLSAWRPAISYASLATFVAGVALVWWLLPSYAPTWASLAAGVVLHGLFILVVHDATHGNLFDPRTDRWIAAVAAGLLLLPFTAARYACLHRIHHARANCPGDNNWTPWRSRLYRSSRLLYMTYELLPVASNIDRLRIGGRADHAAGIVAWITAMGVVLTSAVNIWWYAGALVGLTGINAARLWVEHMGPESAGRVAQTYGGCPFGFGIGNHDLHHRHPSIPAPVLMVGLWLRRHDAHLATGWWRMIRDPAWHHFSEPK